ncbi:efflux RND transporter periplasmic adaptor subunit [Desulfobacterales bacterium HSG17]|nr:efflux RND transporter periplasmic adaptor subunit [Desulfobacterales bacterium HSG17]
MRQKIIFIPLILVLLLIFSCDNEKIRPGFSKDNNSVTNFSPGNIVKVENREMVQMYEAVGTIRPLTESSIESQVSAQVVKVFFTPGSLVKKGQVLIKLDSRQLTSKLEQAKEGLNVAENSLEQAKKAMDEANANLDQAKASYARTKILFEKNIVPSQKLEIDKALYLQTKARLEKNQKAKQAAKASIRQAQEVVKEAGIGRDYTQIKSPAAGIVVQRMIEPGDIAVPGKPLLTIQTSGALRLEASVREGLIGQIVIGHEYSVKIDTIGKIISSSIEEIVPYADPATRTFQVKALLPVTQGVYPGMFGRLLVPVKKENTLLIPKEALIKVGQLEQVYIKKGDAWQRVYIKTGRVYENKIEVLSGLMADETIGYK